MAQSRPPRKQTANQGHFRWLLGPLADWYELTELRLRGHVNAPRVFVRIRLHVEGGKAKDQHHLLILARILLVVRTPFQSLLSILLTLGILALRVERYDMIRIRHPQGTCSFPINDSETTFGALQTFIEQQAGIATAEQELKIGYPPKRLALESIGTGDLLTSAAVGIKKGEQVIVARKAGSSVRTVAAAA